MAITQISRIQHRRGLKEQLPQLAAGEIGFAVDTQELFIGNGTLNDGAPETGNTKILTEDDNILSASQTYSFTGNADTPTVTGADSNSNINRTLQAKLDDYANVKDFGAVGDGVTDDTDAINRAIKNLVTVESTGKEKRKLFFPGGVYVVSDIVKLFPHSNLVGDGAKSTIIRQAAVDSSSMTALLRTADSSGETSANIGGAGTVKPQNISVSDMGFIISTDSPLVVLDQVENVVFRNCSFTGAYANQSGQTNNNALVEINSTSALVTKRISFQSCSFQNSEYGIKINDDAEDIGFLMCEFNKMYRAFNLAEFADGSTANRLTGPTGVFVNGCRFDNIDAEAIKIWDFGGSPHGNIVSGCTFRDVGANSDDSADVPALQFDHAENFAYGNYFYRTDVLSNFGGNIYHESPVQNPATLADNTSSNTDITDAGGDKVQFDIQRENNLQLDYIVQRGSARRRGDITIIGDGASVYLNDIFQENATTGVTFFISSTGIMQFTTTNTGDDATFKYRVKRFVG
jgi:hypothetical protein|tara:strand:+ start:236 stop:1786 length:1551 start_codon:yes stop_codon:yes gene_type:complete